MTAFQIRLVRFAIIAGSKGEDTPNYNAFVREFGVADGERR